MGAAAQIKSGEQASVAEETPCEEKRGEHGQGVRCARAQAAVEGEKGMKSRTALLNYDAFKGLADSELDEIAKLCAPVAYEAGTTICKEGEPVERLYVVEEGKVAVEMSIPAEPKSPQRRVTVDIVTRGELLGWSALVEPYVFTMSAICLDRVRATAIDAAQLRNLLDREPQIGYKVMKSLVGVVSSRLELTRRVLTSERGSRTSAPGG